MANRNIKVYDLKPGSNAAAKFGCTCPRMDNHYGEGWHAQPGIYVISEDCGLHSKVAMAKREVAMKFEGDKNG